MRRRTWFQAAAGGALVTVARAQEALPKHPRDLVFAKLAYDPPDPADYRHELDSGAVAYLVEDHQLPLVTVSMTLRAGSYQVPAESAGLASFTGSQMRSGGTATRSAREFDEDAAFLATRLSSSVGSTSGGASVNCLVQNLDASLAMFFDMLKNPGIRRGAARDLAGPDTAGPRPAQRPARPDPVTGVLAADAGDAFHNGPVDPGLDPIDHARRHAGVPCGAH